eukprot:scaffold110623_cov54-Phaeocystis_antarctica.AAC.1
MAAAVAASPGAETRNVRRLLVSTFAAANAAAAADTAVVAAAAAVATDGAPAPDGPGWWDVRNRDRIGRSEVQLAQGSIDGAASLLQVEAAPHYPYP